MGSHMKSVMMPWERKITTCVTTDREFVWYVSLLYVYSYVQATQFYFLVRNALPTELVNQEQQPSDHRKAAAMRSIKECMLPMHT